MVHVEVQKWTCSRSMILLCSVTLYSEDLRWRRRACAEGRSRITSMIQYRNMGTGNRSFSVLQFDLQKWTSPHRIILLCFVIFDYRYPKCRMSPSPVARKQMHDEASMYEIWVSKSFNFEWQTLIFKNPPPRTALFRSVLWGWIMEIPTGVWVGRRKRNQMNIKDPHCDIWELRSWNFKCYTLNGKNKPTHKAWFCCDL